MYREAATEFGCLVVNAPTANTVAVVEHGIALFVSMAHNVPLGNGSMKADTKYIEQSKIEATTLHWMWLEELGYLNSLAHKSFIYRDLNTSNISVEDDMLSKRRPRQQEEMQAMIMLWKHLIGSAETP
eukprot:Gb_18616 [translate_table: standard]